MSELELIREHTERLTTLGLKSTAAVIQRLAPAISEARRAGYSHRAIHDALNAGGLTTSWTNYRIALGRAGKASAPTAGATATKSGSTLPAEPERDVVSTPSMPQESGKMRTSSATSSATRVMDALAEARKVAASRDYAQIARDLYRRQQREQRCQRNQSKDRS